MEPIGAYILMFNHQGVELFDGVRIMKCGSVGGSVPLGVDFEVSKIHAKSKISLSLVLSPSPSPSSPIPFSLAD